MRILIVTHAPLQPEFGAGQAALNLAAALRGRGHDVVLRSTEPLPPTTRWWNVWQEQRRRAEALLSEAAPVDAIDLPALLVSRRLASAAPVVARSVQPDLLYLRESLRWTVAARQKRGSRSLAAAQALQALRQAAALIAGWRRARLILCQGSLERRWMERRFPFTRSRLGLYDNAPSVEDQRAFRALRGTRGKRSGTGVRFLWIGRWVGHKGTDALLRWMRERADREPEDRFTLAGTGEAAARHCPDDLVDSGRLRLLPGFSRRDLPDLLAEHDAGLFTSRVEGWGLSLNEMLESGMPVFASSAGAVPDLAPFFPRGLRPFPPPPGLVPESPAEDLDANGYYGRFSWPAIATAYEAQLAACLRLPATAAVGQELPATK